ncbi:MAG: transposase [Puniceicoccales bacterium]|nr:transposase [Puniceicoccales bacterium]
MSLATSRGRRQKSQIFYIASTPLPVCEDVRSKAHKVFCGMARWAHSFTGAKFEPKMHLVVDKI